MSILDKIDFRLITEANATDCKMFWCIPCPTDDGFEWQVESMDSNGDDLSNWSIILHKLKHLWKKDFDSCNEKHFSLPRGIVCDGCLYHGNNMPMSIEDVAGSIGVEIGSSVVPKYHKNFIIKQDDMNVFQGILDQDLGLQFTES